MIVLEIEQVMANSFCGNLLKQNKQRAIINWTKIVFEVKRMKEMNKKHTHTPSRTLTRRNKNINKRAHMWTVNGEQCSVSTIHPYTVTVFCILRVIRIQSNNLLTNDKKPKFIMFILRFSLSFFCSTSINAALRCLNRGFFFKFIWSQDLIFNFLLHNSLCSGKKWNS